jgi:hypothetical protein
MGLLPVQNSKRVYVKVDYGTKEAPNAIFVAGKEKTEFGGLKGDITDIMERRENVTVPGKGTVEIHAYQITFTDPEDGTDYVLSLPYRGSLTLNLFNSLCGLPDLNDITVTIWLDKKSQFPRMKVFRGKAEAPWVHGPEKFPPTKTIKVAGKLIKDDDARVAWVAGLVKETASKIPGLDLSKAFLATDLPDGAPVHDNIDDVPF